MPTHDIVVVGGGTAGAFAAATAASDGVSVVVLERKPAADAGRIACGDAIKGAAAFPDVIDLSYLKQESFTNGEISRGIFRTPGASEDVEIAFDETGVVLDRKRYGEVLLEEAERLGAEIRYETVVNDVRQDDEGRVTGVKAVRNGAVETYEAAVVIDGAGALSILQDAADLSETTFDTNVSYTQYCSAYRELLELSDPVAWDDAIVFAPTEQLGYLWYFPRSPTRINAGVGFQMSEEAMNLVEVLSGHVASDPELQNATVVDKLGAALPTRRPYDSAVAPGFLAAGDAAGHVNPTTGGGISGAAKAGHWAGREAVRAISAGEVSEASLWGYNREVMTGFGKRFAAADLYNIWGTSHDVDELTDIVSSVPGQQLVDALSGGTLSLGLATALRTLLNTVGHWGTLLELYRIRNRADALIEQYEVYPSDPANFPAWQRRRDEILQDVYEICGAEPKY